MPADQPVLGVLQLQNLSLDIPGSMGHPGSYEAPVRFMNVPGAWAANVVGSGDGPLQSYVDCARQLETEGCAAITSNCGFTARFQPKIAAAVSIPVAMSSLMLVPQAVKELPPGKTLGLVTYDSQELTEEHVNGAGWSRRDMAVEIVGIEGSECWHCMAQPNVPMTREMIERDVLEATGRLLADHSDIAGIVLECSAFPVACEAVRRATGLPTVHFMTLANRLIGQVTKPATAAAS